MSNEIVFRSGEYQKFRAKMEFHLGPLARNVEKGAEILFDGTMMILNGEEPHSMPQLRGIIKAGWLVPEGEELGEYHPQPAGITVRPADQLRAQQEGRSSKHSMDMVGHEERVVTEHIQNTTDAQIGSGNRIADARPQQGSASVVSGGSLGAQGGKTVGTISKASGASVGAEGSASGAAPIEVTASNIQRLTSEQRRREEAFGKRQVVSSTPEGTDIAEFLEKEDPKTAALLRERRAAAKASEAKVGGHPNDTVNSSSKDEEEQEPIKARLVPKGSDQEEVEDFNWDKSRHWTKRVKDAVDNYASKPRLLRKILASETPKVAAKIESKLEEKGL